MEGAPTVLGAEFSRQNGTEVENREKKKQERCETRKSEVFQQSASLGEREREKSYVLIFRCEAEWRKRERERARKSERAERPTNGIRINNRWGIGLVCVCVDV